ncbi:unnamed protein product [Owenia fusiformis]|uniref:Uncharacterized protein n=1 Tax=Owenia fusiformis TaxID=6347 RepID=A0A8J1THV3_OWEFU|nr:unnamed protein product [Owenia fusiformis]
MLKWKYKRHSYHADLMRNEELPNTCSDRHVDSDATISTVKSWEHAGQSNDDLSDYLPLSSTHIASSDSHLGFISSTESDSSMSGYDLSMEDTVEDVTLNPPLQETVEDVVLTPTLSGKPRCIRSLDNTLERTKSDLDLYPVQLNLCKSMGEIFGSSRNLREQEVKQGDVSINTTLQVRRKMLHNNLDRLKLQTANMKSKDTKMFDQFEKLRKMREAISSPIAPPRRKRALRASRTQSALIPEDMHVDDEKNIYENIVPATGALIPMPNNNNSDDTSLEFNHPLTTNGDCFIKLSPKQLAQDIAQTDKENNNSKLGNVSAIGKQQSANIDSLDITSKHIVIKDINNINSKHILTPSRNLKKFLTKLTRSGKKKTNC